MHTYNFEKLEIWNLSIDLAIKVYNTTNAFPESERFGLIVQLRRASSSISSNIAEGLCRFSKRDRARFIEIAYGSSIEVLNHLILSNKLDFINSNELEEYRLTINELTNKINSFYKSIS